MKIDKGICYRDEPSASINKYRCICKNCHKVFDFNESDIDRTRTLPHIKCFCGNDIQLDVRYYIPKTLKNFFDIHDSEISIHFSNQDEFEKLINVLKKLGYYYGSNYSDLNELKKLGIRYFGESFYLTLDRSSDYKYVSAGLGICNIYDFDKLKWEVI